MRTKLLVFVLAAATLLAACGSSTTTAVPTVDVEKVAAAAAATAVAQYAADNPPASDVVNPTVVVTSAPEATQTTESALDAPAQPAVAPPSGAWAVEGERVDLGYGLIAVNLPTNVAVKKPSDEYKNSLGSGSEYWMGEPGVRTADAGDPNCDPKFSCWHINPDVQHDLTAIAGEAIDLNEDAFTMCAFSRGTFTFAGETQITFAPTPMHSWLFIMKGLPPGDGDRNVQVVVTDYDAGFMTCTNLPAGAMISEDYVFQNFENMFDELCGAIDHCSSGSLVFYGHEKKVITAFYQDSPQGDLIHVIKNLSIGQ